MKQKRKCILCQTNE